MSRTLTLIAFFVLAHASAAAVTVNCDRGESINRALAKLDRKASNTVEVKGTCAEYVEVRGFEGLTLQGLGGATLVQPAGPPSSLVRGVLMIDSSRSVTVDGLKVQGSLADLSGILIWRGSADVRLRNITTEGGMFGILVAEKSQVSIAGVIGREPGYATLGVFDASDVHVEDCLFEGHTASQFFNVGIDVGQAHLTIHGTTIRNMQHGMLAQGGGVIDVVEFNSYFPLGGAERSRHREPGRQQL